MDVPLLSVCLITYNHSKFIRQAIEGVLIQKVNFAWELIIADDFSTDGTRKILLEYKQKYPDFIRLVLQPQNVGPAKNWLDLVHIPDSKYIAYFEGDDYWTDPLKLQKQVNFLESHLNISGCFHDVCNVDESGDILKENYFESYQETYNQFDCVTKLGSSYASCSLVFRSLVLKKLPPWFINSPSDYAIDILITEYGDLAHIKGNMAAYRIHKGGTWQGNKPRKNMEEALDRYKILLSDHTLKKKYGHYFRKMTMDLSYAISIAYRKEHQWINQLKYAWFFFLYREEKNIDSFRFFASAALSPLRFLWRGFK